MSTCQHVQSLYPSPVGVLRIIANPLGLVAILFDNESGEGIKLPELLACSGNSIYIVQAKKWLDTYFLSSVSLTEKENMLNNIELPPLLLTQFTKFEQRAILALQAIGFGKTISYAELAEKAGSPAAVRAVGSAIGKNPFSILLPCHRVLRSDGALGGYAGGLTNKKYLLELEAKTRNLQ